MVLQCTSQSLTKRGSVVQQTFIAIWTGCRNPLPRPHGPVPERPWLRMPSRIRTVPAESPESSNSASFRPSPNPGGLPRTRASRGVADCSTREFQASGSHGELILRRVDRLVDVARQVPGVARLRDLTRSDQAPLLTHHFLVRHWARGVG